MQGVMMSRWPKWSQKKITFDLLGYDPHDGQIPYHQSDARVLIVVGGERAGKSAGTEKEIIARWPWCTRGKRIGIAAQEYDETRREMEYLAEDLAELGALQGQPTMPKAGKWIITGKGGIVAESISLQDGADELTGTGLPFDIIALVEAGHITKEALTAALGRTMETRGVVIVSGTLLDSFGWHADLYNTCLAGPEHNAYSGASFSWPTWFNKTLFPLGENDPEIIRMRSTMPKDEFDRRVAAKVVPSPARIFPEHDSALHAQDVPYDPTLPVTLWLDAGYYPSHYAVAVVQFAEEQVENAAGDTVTIEVVNQIDEIWEHHLGHRAVYEMCKDREWWPGVVRVVGGHETKQHNESGETTQEVWQAFARADGFRLPFRVFNAGRILDGISRVRTFLIDPTLEVPRYRYDRARCVGTQEEFNKYSRKTNQRHEVTSEQPEDKNNDAMDCIRNGLVERYGFAGRRRGVSRPSKRRLPNA